MDTILQFETNPWIIFEGSCPVTLQLDHPRLGMITIDKFQRKEEACKEILEKKTILWMGDTYTLNKVWVALKEKTGFGIDWYYFTIKEEVSNIKYKVQFNDNLPDSKWEFWGFEASCIELAQNFKDKCERLKINGPNCLWRIVKTEEIITPIKD